jgi:hypothetical protein
MKTWERLFITFMLCVTIIFAVWLHGTLTRYEVCLSSHDDIIRNDRITGRVWVLPFDREPVELGVKSEFAK